MRLNLATLALAGLALVPADLGAEPRPAPGARPMLTAAAPDSAAPAGLRSDSTIAASDSVEAERMRALDRALARVDSTDRAARPASATGAAGSSAVAPRDSGAADTLAVRLIDAGEIPPGAGGPGPLEQAAGVASDAFGRIWASDAIHHRLQRYDERGQWLGESGALGSGEGRLRRPGAIAPLGTLHMAVLDRENRRVVLYDLFGRLQGTVIDLAGAGLEDELGRIEPVDLAADRGGNLYVADADRDRILAFDPSGRYARTLGGFGARAGSFRGLHGLATGRRGEVLAAERVNARLQRLDPGGRVLGSWPLAVKPARAALAVAADDSGHVAVADEASGTVWLFDVEGRALAAFTGLRAPRALAFHRDGTLLVAENGHLRRLRIVRGRDAATKGQE